MSLLNQVRRLVGRIESRLHVVAKRDLEFLVVLVLLTCGAWLFAELADEVIAGETRDLDERILLALRDPDDRSDPIGPEWIEEVGRDLTALGGVGVLALLTAAVIGHLLLLRKRRMAVLVAASVGGGVLFSVILKSIFDRPRPDLVPHESYVFTTSFPSGHSMIAAVVYLTLAALLARSYQRTQLKLYFLTMAVLITGLVGISRVYVGVHWPTDVLAGWTAGAFWAILWWGIGYGLQRQGRVEGEKSATTGELT